MGPDDEGTDARPRADPWLEEEQRRNPFDALPGAVDAEGDDDEMAPDFGWPENASEQDDELNPVEEAWGSGIYERGRQRTREKTMHRSSSRHSRVRHKDEGPRQNYWIQPRYRKLIFRVSTACGVAWVLVATAAIASVVFYVTVYTQYVPGSIEVQVPLYLDYEPETGIRPSAVVKLGQADQQWTLAGPASEDVSLIPTGLAKAQLYDVSVQFSIREVDMGNFMISSELLGHLDKILATSKRPALAHRRLEPVSRSWLGWIFNSRESLEDLKGVPVNLKVDLFERYTELSEPVDRIQSIRITLSTPAVQVFDASVRFQCRLTGFVWYMYHWRITSFLVFMTVVCTIEAVLAYSMVLVFGVTSAIVTFAAPDDADIDLSGHHAHKHGKRRERTSRSRHRDD